jgi:hypothetical protein
VRDRDDLVERGKGQDSVWMDFERWADTTDFLRKPKWVRGKEMG